eukprot:8728885-Alexandrium_andersonii.AAC.1
MAVVIMGVAQEARCAVGGSFWLGGRQRMATFTHWGLSSPSPQVPSGRAMRLGQRAECPAAD